MESIRRDRELRAQVRHSTELYGHIFSLSFFVTGLASLIFYFIVEARGSRTSSTWILVVAIMLLFIGGLGIVSMIIRRQREK
jgi:cytochrome c oxidase subunit IV